MSAFPGVEASYVDAPDLVGAYDRSSVGTRASCRSNLLDVRADLGVAVAVLARVILERLGLCDWAPVGPVRVS